MRRGLHVTPELVEASYERLRLTLPFKAWGLPHADDLAFHVTNHKDRYAHFTDENGKGNREIGISCLTVRSLYALDMALAHEMVHVKEWLELRAKFKGIHGRRFNQLAAQVCRVHGFDLDRF